VEIGNEHQHNEENHGLEANPLRIAVSVAVPGNYWYRQQSRQAEALNKLYANLFYAENDQLKIQAAQDVWQAIKKNPQSPQGPLTLAAISQAILISADFNDPSDSRAFFEFLQHNPIFQKLFLAIMVKKLDQTLLVGDALRALFVDPSRYAVDLPRGPQAGVQINREVPAIQEFYERHEEKNQAPRARNVAHHGLEDPLRSPVMLGDIALEDLNPEDANSTSSDSEIQEDVLERQFDHSGVVLGTNRPPELMQNIPSGGGILVNRPQENLLPLETLVVDVIPDLPLARPPVDDITRLASIWLSGEPNLAVKLQAAVDKPAVIKDLFEFAPAITGQLPQRTVKGQNGWCLKDFARLCPELLGIALRPVEGARRLPFSTIFSTEKSLIKLLTSWLSSEATQKVDEANINLHPLAQQQSQVQAQELEQLPQPEHEQAQDDKGKQEVAPGDNEPIDEQEFLPQDLAGQENRPSRYRLTELFSGNAECPLDPDAFINHLNRCKDTHPEIVASVAKMMAHALSYFTKDTPYILVDNGRGGRQSEIDKVIAKIAAGRFSAREYDQYLELRYCLYHPDCVKAAGDFWLNNFNSFKLAAGVNDEFLLHLIANMPDPIAFVKKMLYSEPPVAGLEDEAQDRVNYFSSRIAKIMPVLGKVPGNQANKERNRLLNMTIYGGVGLKEKVRGRLQLEINNLIDAYKGKNDPKGQLMAMLNDDYTRGQCRLDATQVAKLLGVDPADPLGRVNSRFEIIIAGDDYLFKQARSILPCPVGTAEQQELQRKIQRAKYPYLAARIELESAMKKGLMNYITEESTHYETFLGNLHRAEQGERQALINAYYHQSGRLTIRKAYLVATKKKFWSQINPADRYPVQAFIHSLVPGLFPKLTRFFEGKERQLSSLNPIFKMRLAWNKLPAKDKKNLTFEQYMVRAQATPGRGPGIHQEPLPNNVEAGEELPLIVPQTRVEFAALIADVTRGTELWDTFAAPSSVQVENAGTGNADTEEGGKDKAEAEDAFVQPVKYQYSDFEHKLLENSSRLEAFLVEVNSSARVLVASEFIESINAGDGPERIGTVRALTAKQVFRFLMMSAAPIGQQFSEGQKLAQRLIAKNPDLLGQIFLEPAHRENLPNVLEALYPLIMQMLQTDPKEFDISAIFTSEMLCVMLNAGLDFLDFFKADIRLLRWLLSGNELAAMPANDFYNHMMAVTDSAPVLTRLEAKDLLRIGELNRETLDRLLVDSQPLRRKLLDLQWSEISNAELASLSQLFKAEPACLFNFINKLSVVQLNSLADFNDDIFNFAQPEGHPPHPFYNFLVQGDAACNPELILKCLHSNYGPWKQLLRNALEMMEPGRCHQLLAGVLLSRDCYEADLIFLLSNSDPERKRGVLINALSSPAFVQNHLAWSEDARDDDRLMVLWSKLVNCNAINEFITCDPVAYLDMSRDALYVQHQNFLAKSGHYEAAPRSVERVSPRASMRFQFAGAGSAFSLVGHENNPSEYNSNIK
jgi:hypothetical protein